MLYKRLIFCRILEFSLINYICLIVSVRTKMRNSKMHCGPYQLQKCAVIHKTAVLNGFVQF